MLKHIIALVAAVIFAGFTPATAQSAEEIARVKAGEPCQGCNLFQADFSYENLPEANVANARLRQANLSLSTMDGASLRNANLSLANMFGARFTGADFERADLERATLVGAYFGGANFAEARLTGAVLSGADLETALGLTQAQISAACGDESTRLPEGLTLPSCR
ncbi:MAG: pentapeptide repeat-containing protein [Pseudomonadota bacterium]